MFLSQTREPRNIRRTVLFLSHGGGPRNVSSHTQSYLRLFLYLRSSVFVLLLRPYAPALCGAATPAPIGPGPDQPAFGTHCRSSRLQDVVVDGAIDVEVGADGLGWRG
jgi:hypothetical protein